MKHYSALRNVPLCGEIARSDGLTNKWGNVTCRVCKRAGIEAAAEYAAEIVQRETGAVSALRKMAADLNISTDGTPSEQVRQIINEMECRFLAVHAIK